MQLPYSEELNIGSLSRLFDNTTNCYKFFWFQAILSKLDSEHSRLTFDELINEMIADAWYMVTEYHLNLLPSWELYFDGLGELQYRAYCLKTDNELVAKEFNKIAPYH